MKLTNKEEVMCLRDAVVGLQDFVKCCSNGELPYFYRFLDYMKNNIEIFLRVGGRDIYALEKVLYRSWHEANDFRIGLSTFQISAETETESIEIYYQYALLVKRVAEYFAE